MADKNTIKNWFKTGLKPTQGQFWATWDSFWHKEEMIPITAIEDIESILNAKAEAEVLDDHLTSPESHADLFGAKEDKLQKGVASGYAPLNEFTKIASQYLNIVDDLVSGGSTSLLSAEQGKVLNTQIIAINTLLNSDNINLDTVQEIVDAIEAVEISLNTILVNDLTTGGITKALTAEMGKTLKVLIEALYISYKETDINYPAEITFRPGKITEQNGIFKIDFGIDNIVKDKISKMKPYYCNYETGSNSNDGLTPNTAVKTINYAYTTLGARLVYLTGGVHKRDSWGKINGTFVNTDDFFVLQYGNRETYITNAASTDPTYSLQSGTTYQYTLSGNSVNVIDMKYRDKKGFPLRMTQQSSIALVNANPGSFYAVGTTVYVNLPDGRVPDAQVLTLPAGIDNASYWANAGYHFVKGITFMGGSSENGTHGVSSQTGSNSTLVSLMKDCKFLYGHGSSYDANGGEGTRNVYNKINIVENCIAYGNSRDGFNYLADAVGGNRMYTLEIDCQGFWNGEKQTSTSVNGSSAHGPCEVIRINGKHYANSGPNVADVDGSIVANYGVIAFGSISPDPVNNPDFTTNSTNGVVSKQYNFKVKSYNSAVSFRVGGSQESHIINKDVFYKGPLVINNPSAPQTITFGDFPTANVVSVAFPNLSAYTPVLEILSGTYVPILTGTLNITAVTLNYANYIRIGNIVHVMVGFTTTVPVANTNSNFTITLPFSKATSGSSLLGSGGLNNPTPASSAVVCQASTTTAINCIFLPLVNINTFSGSVSFQYDVTQ